MFRDLAEGIAELFEEASGQGERYLVDQEGMLGAGISHNNWTARQLYEKQANRAMRVVRVAYAIPPPASPSEKRCAFCAVRLFKHEGYTHWRDDLRRSHFCLPSWRTGRWGSPGNNREGYPWLDHTWNKPGNDNKRRRS